MNRLRLWWRYDAVWQLHRLCEDTVMWIAWHLPRTLVMWCAVRVAAHATTVKAPAPDAKYGSHKHPDDVSVMAALDAWMR